MKLSSLIDKFPKLYENIGFFECGEGWYDLLYDLSVKLEPFDVIVLQVKEKYGGLRFYITGGSDEVFDLITETENKSYSICMTCGSEGKLRKHNGWSITLCDKCDSIRHKS